MTRAELKQQAKEALRGKWGWGIGVAFLGAILGSLLGSFTASILTTMVLAGVRMAYLALIDGENQPGVFDAIFSGFTEGRALPVFLNNFLATIFTALWTCLFIIPGIVKALSYSQVNYIIKDLNAAGKDISATEAINRSRELMNGHKWEFFVLQLSFLGWAILCSFTLGIGFLWLAPYVQATDAAYYRSIAGYQYSTQL